MTVSEFVKPKREANRNGNADISENAEEPCDSFGFLREEENHVSAYRELRHLQRHRNDYAKHHADDEYRGPALAQRMRRQFMFEPAKPIRINRACFGECRTHRSVSATNSPLPSQGRGQGEGLVT